MRVARHDEKIQELLDDKRLPVTAEGWQHLTPEERAEALAYQKLAKRLCQRRLPAMSQQLADTVAASIATYERRPPMSRWATLVWRRARLAAIAAALALCLTWFLEPRQHAAPSNPAATTNQEMANEVGQREQLHRAIYDTTRQLLSCWPGALTRSASDEREWQWPQLWYEPQTNDKQQSFDSFKEYFHETFRHMGNLLHDYAGFAAPEQG